LPGIAGFEYRRAVQSAFLPAGAWERGKRKFAMPQFYNSLPPPDVSQKQAGLIEILNTYGWWPLRDYIKLFSENQVPPLQAREDLIGIAAAYAERLLGPQAAAALAAKLSATPVILTANHHGVDYMPMYVQGSLIYALASIPPPGEDAPGAVFPVFAYGSVSLNNATHPRGILLARKQAEKPAADPDQQRHSVRVNIFPDSQKHTMVSAAPPFTREMVQRALKQVAELHAQDIISPLECAILQSLLGEEYLSEDVLAQAGYSDQAVLLNHRIWQRFFAPELRSEMPSMVYLEMEKIVAEVLCRDLASPDSLAYQILFDPALREALFTALDGQHGCWERASLHTALGAGIDRETRRGLLQKGGTEFFWGVDGRGRRVHLMLEDKGETRLRGVDDQGQAWECAYTPDGLSHALRAGRLLPALFLTFLEVSFARGFRCFGGPWQTTYLPIMQAGLVNALNATGRHDTAEICGAVRTANYVAGMVVAVARYPADMSAAGPVEILAGGGLSRADLERIANMRVEDAIRLGDDKGAGAVPAIIARYYGEQLLQMQF
jgi:hypothetical protein